MAGLNPPSTAKVGGHPIHPMLIPFPITFLGSALATDLIFWFTRGEGWATASLWLLGAGILTALVAAVAGFTDFLGSNQVRSLSHAWQHMIGNLIAVALAIVNYLIRLGNAAEAVLPWGILLSLAVVLLLGFTGWRGGDLVYHHRVGVKQPEA